ncbi:hypothetical protein Trydic_g20066 [Trypoxylus dichotomus]
MTYRVGRMALLSEILFELLGSGDMGGNRKRVENASICNYYYGRSATENVRAIRPKQGERRNLRGDPEKRSDVTTFRLSLSQA